MKTVCDIRLFVPRLWLIVAVMVIVAVCGGKSVLAQTPTPALSEQKIDQLIKLLDDPEVRALLNKSAATPASPAEEPAADMSAETFSTWGSRIREHLRNVGQAVPQVSSEFMRAGSTIAAEINGHGPFGVFLLFLTLVLIGLGAEWLFQHRIASRSRRPRGVWRPAKACCIGPATTCLPFWRRWWPSAWRSLGLFMALTWPPLLEAIMLPLLLGVIACRFVTRIARLLLVGPPSRKKGWRPPGASLRSMPPPASSGTSASSGSPASFLPAVGARRRDDGASYRSCGSRRRCLHAWPRPFAGWHRNRLEPPCAAVARPQGRGVMEWASDGLLSACCGVCGSQA